MAQNKLVHWFAGKIATLVRNAESERQRASYEKFANRPENLLIQQPVRLVNASRITMGNDVSLGPGCMLNAIRRYPGRFMKELPDDVEVQSFSPSITIGNRVSATGYLTVSAVESVSIEDDVLLASHIFIADHSHGRSRTDIAFKYQPLEDIAPVVIEQGCWLGEHVVVMPGVSIGAFSIVGANSVVTRNVPSRSMVAGSPARVIKTWSDSERAWVAPA